jgi:hypothetical protein
MQKHRSLSMIIAISREFSTLLALILSFSQE